MAVSRFLHVLTQHFIYSITLSLTTDSNNVQWSLAILKGKRRMRR